MRLLAAIEGRSLDHPPVWFMRQAGRYLPEYRALRERYGFQEAVRRPDIASEITLQPWRRFDLDAAIVFADIMTPLEGFGIEVDFAPGPRLEPISIDALAGLGTFDVAAVGFVGETIASVREHLPRDRAVIGFAGAPATLAAYLLEGGGSKTFLALRRALSGSPDTAAAALGVLGRAMREYLVAQVDAGADVVMLFDSWAGLLPLGEWTRLAMPAARVALEDVGVPTIYFAPGAGGSIRAQTQVGSSVTGVDWRLDLAEVRAAFPDRTLQGNLDPGVLLGSPAAIEDGVRRVLEAAGTSAGHVFNLGHGFLPETPVENAELLVKLVHDISREVRS